MNRVTRGTVVLAAALGALSCAGDPTDSLRNGVNHLQANPGTVFVTYGSIDTSQKVVVQAVDEQGNALNAKFELTPPNNPSVTVVEDTSYNLIAGADGIFRRPNPWTRAQYIVVAKGLTANDSFSVKVGRISLKIPVRVLPDTSLAPTPVLGRTPTAAPDSLGFGDTLTLTVQAPFRFTQQSLLFFFDSTGSSIKHPLPVKFSTDSTTVYFVAVPGTAYDTVRVRGITMDYAPGARIYTHVTDTGFVTRIPTGGATGSLPKLTRPDSALAQPGDTVRLTIAAPFKYSTGRVSPTGVVSGPAGAIVGFSPDSSTAFLVVGLAPKKPITLNNLTIYSYNGLGRYSVTSANDSIGTDTTSTLLVPSATNVNAADTVSITAPAPWKFSPGVTAISGTFPAGIIGYSPDSSTVKILMSAGASTRAKFTGMTIRGNARVGLYGLSTTVPIISGPLASFPATFSSATPASQDTVTLTAGAGFKLLPNAKISTGGQTGVVVSVAADSGSLKFVPIPGTGTGAVSVTGVALAAVPTVSLTAPTSGSITAPAPLTGTDAIATAPTIVIPATGSTTMYVDAGAFATGPSFCSGALQGPCRLYKFTIATSRTFSVSARWQGTTDVGIYFTTNGTSQAGTGACDAKSNGPTGQPESCTQTLAAGTYYLVVDSFAPFYAPPDDVDPLNFNITLIGQ